MGCVRLIGREEMAGVRNHHQLRVRNALGNQFSVAQRHQPVGLAVEDKRGHLNPGESAVGFPGKDALQLRDVCFRPRKPGPADRDVLIDPPTRGG